MLPYDMREWLSWWSTTLPRSGSRVRVPSRALNEAKAFSYEGFRFFWFPREGLQETMRFSFT